MQRAGWFQIDPYREDVPEEQRPIDRPEPPVYSTVKFNLWGETYLYDTVRPVVREALEAHLKEGKRSSEAVWLSVLLQKDEFDDYVFFRCKSKLSYILQRIKPI